MAQAVGVVVGENLLRLRERARLTQHETARLMLRRGFPWTRSKIAAAEAGERPNLSFADALALAHTFNVELSELVEGDGDVELTPYVVLPRPAVRDIVRGLATLDGSASWDVNTRRDELFELARQRGAGEARKAAPFQAAEADEALASRLEVAPAAVIAVAMRLWNRTLTEERDHRVALLGDKEVAERQAYRGHITRELSKQIQSELDENRRTRRTSE